MTKDKPQDIPPISKGGVIHPADKPFILIVDELSSWNGKMPPLPKRENDNG